MNISIYNELFSVWKNNSNKMFISIDNDEINFEQFNNEVEKIKNSLKKYGIKPKDSVGIILSNSFKWCELYWAIESIGAIPVPFDPQIGEWELKRLIEITNIKLCFIEEKYRANNILENILIVKYFNSLALTIVLINENNSKHISIQNLKNLIKSKKNEINLDEENIKEFLSKELIYFSDFIKDSKKDDNILSQNEVYEINDILMYACTSGTTGNPKVIVVPKSGFYKSQLNMSNYLELGAEDKMLLGMPLYHQGGFGMGLQMLLAGGSVSYLPTFDPIKFLELIQDKKITCVQLTTTLAKILLSVPNFNDYDISSLEICYFAGEVLPNEIARIFYDDLGKRVVNVIGSSETATMVVWDSKYDKNSDVNVFKKLNFTDLLLLNNEKKNIEIGEVGSIFIKTEALLKEYLQNEKETNNKLISINNEIWFDTGDLGIKIDDNKVKFVGREKRIIKRGANLIYSEEIESFLINHPNIESIAIVGERHILFGEMIVAYIKLKEGNKINRGNIVNFCKGKISSYKIPDEIRIVDEIPHDLGKVQFKYLRGK